MILRTGWDVDGVGHVFGDSFRNWLIYTDRDHLWKSGPTPEPYWNWYKDWGWTTEQFVEECNAAADAGILFDGPIRPGYAESIERVARAGHQIIVVTDRAFGSSPRVSEAITVQWFDKHSIEYDELVFSADKTCVQTDTFIEDKWENFVALTNAGTDCYLLNRPWNVQYGPHPKRIDFIEQYADAIEEISERGFVDLAFI